MIPKGKRRGVDKEFVSVYIRDFPIMNSSDER
jgi:hypothetical protein